MAWTMTAQAAERPPNLVILFADDLGYGDLCCYGHPSIRTPNLDRMASEGLRFTDFYSAAPVCTPSRAALLTGRLPIRSGMVGTTRHVLFPDSKGGLPASEITIAEALKTKGYATACVGKWHLGHLPQYLPTRNGFDSYYGIPYSNDMKPSPILRNEEVIEEPAVQETLTPRYTDEAIKFIRREKDKPFFLYLAYNFPHVPLHVSDRFKDKSLRGLYGDVVEEIDWSVGEVLRTLRELGLAEKTLVVFSSDNGPWLIKNQHGGSAGLLRDGKGSTW
ncbi:MAG: sulfatase family protein, partial [Phycisphaerae bacterium]